MKYLKVAGLDPSLSHFGMVKGELDLETGKLFNLQLRLIQTSPDNQNKIVRKNSTDLKRCRKLHIGMQEFIKDVAMVFVEIPVGSQSARAMASYGMCIGVVAAIQQAVIQVTPTEVKVAATGNKTASKADMIKWAKDAYPDAEWIERVIKGVKNHVNKNEHLSDSLAAIYAGVRTDQFKHARAMLLATEEQ